MGLARPAVTQHDHRFAGIEVGARCQGCHLPAVDSGGGREVEVAQTLEPREPGLGDAAGAPALCPLVELGRQHFDQELEMRETFTLGDLRQSKGLLSHRRQA